MSKKENIFASTSQVGVMHIQRVAFFISDSNQTTWETAWIKPNVTPQP